MLIMPWDRVVFDPETGQNIGGKGIIVDDEKAVADVTQSIALNELAKTIRNTLDKT